MSFDPRTQAYLDFTREGRLQLGEQINDARNAAYDRASGYALAVLRTLIAAHGGGIAILIALVGHLASRDEACTVSSIALAFLPASLTFAAGLVLVMLSLLMSFLSLQMGAGRYANLQDVSTWVMSDPAQKNVLVIQRTNTWINRLFWGALLTSVGSMIGFAAGVALVVWGVFRLAC